MPLGSVSGSNPVQGWRRPSAAPKREGQHPRRPRRACQGAHSAHAPEQEPANPRMTLNAVLERYEAAVMPSLRPNSRAATARLTSRSGTGSVASATRRSTGPMCAGSSPRRSRPATRPTRSARTTAPSVRCSARSQRPGHSGGRSAHRAARPDRRSTPAPCAQRRRARSGSERLPRSLATVLPNRRGNWL